MVTLELSEWLVPDEFPASGDLSVRFVDAGSFVSAEFADGKKVEQFVVTVEAGRGVTRKWTMNKTSQRAVAERLGVDTERWVGETADLFLVDSNVSGKMRKVIYARGK